jgi:hypothetical protein
MQRHSYLNDLMMMYTGVTASRARGAFIGIVASAVVGYALKRLQGRRAGLWSISL